MAQKIGYQDGIDWLVGWVRKISLGTVKYRPVDQRPRSLEQWYGLEKLERTLRILKEAHDGTVLPPPPPLPSVLGRNVMFTAWNPETALRCPPHWRVAVSADPAYDTAVRAAAPRIKAQGNRLAVWGVQTQVGEQRIRDLAAELGADFVIFQAETPEEYDTAVAAGAQLIVGNPSSWTQAQRDDAIGRGDALATLFEVYANAGSPWPDAASSQNVPVSSEVLGVGWGDNRYQLADYRPHTPAGVWASMSVYLAENMSDESWGMLP